MQFAWLCTPLSFALAALCLLPLSPRPALAPLVKNASPCWPAAFLLFFCIFARSFGGYAVPFSWNSTALTAVALSFFVAGGKALGGFCCGRWGAGRLSLLSIPLAALLTAFCPQLPLPALLGQLLLNLSMPVTLFLMDQALPGSPGFSFGLAASALIPGLLCAQMLPASLHGRTALTLVVAAVNLGCILLALGLLRRGSRSIPPCERSRI